MKKVMGAWATTNKQLTKLVNPHAHLTCGNYTLIDFVGVIGKNNGENASHWCLSSLCMHAMKHHVCKMKINEAVMQLL